MFTMTDVLVRELLESYHITGEQRYLEKAEYLMEYVLDGWDCTLDEQGNPLGGITWGRVSHQALL